MRKETREFCCIISCFLLLLLIQAPAQAATHAFYEGTDSSLVISTSSSGGSLDMRQIVVTTSHADSSSYGTPAITVNIPETLDARLDKQPAISINPINKEIFIVWSRMDADGHDFEIACCTYNFGEWSGVYHLTNNEFDDENPTVTHDVGGGVHIAWRTFDDDNSIYYTKMSAEGEIELKLNLSGDTSAENGPPELLVADNGYPFIAMVGRLKENANLDDDGSILIFSSWNNSLGQGAQDIPTLLRVTDVSLEQIFPYHSGTGTVTSLDTENLKINSTTLEGKSFFYWLDGPGEVLYFAYFEKSGLLSPQKAISLQDGLTLTEALEMIRISLRERQIIIKTPTEPRHIGPPRF